MLDFFYFLNAPRQPAIKSNSNTYVVATQIKGGIQGFREPRPAIVFVTSAGVERNAKIGNDETARKADIPIVQLNPGELDAPIFNALLAVHTIFKVVLTLALTACLHS